MRWIALVYLVSVVTVFWMWRRACVRQRVEAQLARTAPRQSGCDGFECVVCEVAADGEGWGDLYRAVMKPGDEQ